MNNRIFTSKKDLAPHIKSILLKIAKIQFPHITSHGESINWSYHTYFGFCYMDTINAMMNDPKKLQSNTNKLEKFILDLEKPESLGKFTSDLYSYYKKRNLEIDTQVLKERIELPAEMGVLVGLLSYLVKEYSKSLSMTDEKSLGIKCSM